MIDQTIVRSHIYTYSSIQMPLISMGFAAWFSRLKPGNQGFRFGRNEGKTNGVDIGNDDGDGGWNRVDGGLEAHDELS